MQCTLSLFCSAALLSLSPFARAQNPAANAATPTADLPTGTPAGAASAPGQTTGGTPAASGRPVAPPQPFYQIGGFGLSGYLRVRPENYDWFSVPGKDNDYTFTGTQLRLSGVKSTPKLDIQLDLQATALTSVPDNAVGIGALYKNANGSRDGAISIKQAFVRFKNAIGNGQRGAHRALRVQRWRRTENDRSNFNFSANAAHRATLGWHLRLSPIPGVRSTALICPPKSAKTPTLPAFWRVRPRAFSSSKATITLTPRSFCMAPIPNRLAAARRACSA